MCCVVLYGAGTNVIVSEIASFYAPVCAVESAGFLQELIVKFFEDYCLQNWRSNGISLYSTSRNQALSLDRFSFKGGEESVVIEEEQREGLEL